MITPGDLIAAIKIFLAAVLPGAPLAWGVVRRARWRRITILPLSFAATLTFAGLAGLLGRFVGFDLDVAIWLSVALAAATGVVGMWHGLADVRKVRKGEETGDDVEDDPLLVRSDWQGLALGFVVWALALWQRPWIAFTTDTFYHLAAVRSLVATGRTMVTDPMHGTDVTTLDATSGLYHTWLAMVAKVSQEPVELLMVGATALGAAMVIWAMWALAERTGRCAWAATLATIGFGVLSLYSDFRMFGYPNRLSLALVFIAILALMEIGGRHSVSSTIALVVAGFAALGAHLGSAAFIGVVAVMIVAWWAAWGLAHRKEKDAFKPFLRLAVPMTALAVLASPLIVSKLGAVFSSEIFTGDIPLKARETALWFITDKVMVVIPGVFVGGGAVAFWVTAAIAVAVAVAAFRSDRKDLLPVAAVLAIPLLLLFDPPLTSAAIAVSYYTFARIALLLGFIPWLAVAWAAAEASRTVGKRRIILALSAAAIAASATVAQWTPMKATWVRGTDEEMRIGESYTVFESREADVRNGWGSALWDVKVAVDDEYPLVAADPETGYYLAGLAPVAIVAAPRSHSPLAIELVDGPQRRADMARLLDPDASVEERREILEHYGAEYVALSPGIGNDGPAYESMLAQPDLFKPVVESRRLVLLKVLPEE